MKSKNLIRHGVHYFTKQVLITEVGKFDSFRLSLKSKKLYHISTFKIVGSSLILVKDLLTDNNYKVLSSDTIVYVLNEE